MRGLITLETGDGGVDVRVAHPLHGEVRRKRAATTRLRRLRGLVATELARLDRGDDIRTVVRRAALTLDSDLRPDPRPVSGGRPTRYLARRSGVGRSARRGGSQRGEPD